ncbi:MAG TPA: FHA domain-containing protein [Verrucomicrobiae bacterium]
MAKLVIKSEGFKNQVIELRLGVNCIGRSPSNDFVIDHPTISAKHCEVEVDDEGVTVRDCESTNGTYVAERPVKQASLWAGQVLRLGDVELLVESTDVTIAIPKFDTPRPMPPVVLDDGTMLCPKHPKALVTHQCTHCRLVMCDECVHRMRRRGGKVLKLCPECSHPCEPLVKPEKKKKTLLGFLAKTVKMPFLHRKNH